MLDVLYLDVVYAMYAFFVVYRAYVVYVAYVCLHVIMYAWLDVCGNNFIEWFHHYWYFCQDVISPFYAYPFPRENQKSWKMPKTWQFFDGKPTSREAKGWSSPQQMSHPSGGDSSNFRFVCNLKFARTENMSVCAAWNCKVACQSIGQILMSGSMFGNMPEKIQVVTRANMAECMSS